MSDTRTTGATEKQIEAGIRRRLASMYNDGEITDALVADCGSFYEELFECFVGPDQRIVEVADLRMIVGGLSTEELEGGECPALNRAASRVWDAIRDGE